jgi:thiol-disulfide isomerase/thioredoxin
VSSFPVFLISAFFGAHREHTSGHLGSQVKRINRVYQSFTLAAPDDPRYPTDVVAAKYDGNHKRYVSFAGFDDWVFGPASWRKRLREDLLKRQDDGTTKGANRIDRGCPTLFDVEYLELEVPSSRQEMIELFQIWQQETGYALRTGLFRFVPKRGPYWTQASFDANLAQNLSFMGDLVPLLDFIAPWCHPVDRTEWSDQRWKDNYARHIDSLVSIARRYNRLCYPDTTLNYHPSSKAKGDQLLEPARVKWLISRMMSAGCHGVIIDASTEASKVPVASVQWQAMLETL